MLKVMQIRKEFNEPFKDVISGFAEMGYSKRATAEILEIDRGYFYKCLLPRYAPDVTWKKQIDMRPECRAKGKGWPKGKSRNNQKKYTDEDLLMVVAKYETVEKFDNKAIPSASTVIKRFGSWNKARRMATCGEGKTCGECSIIW